MVQHHDSVPSLNCTAISIDSLHMHRDSANYLNLLFHHFISVPDTVEVCKFLISKSSSPFSPGRLADGATPFWMACKKGRKGLVQAMVKSNKSHDILSLALKQVQKSVLTGEQ